jgi:uncharacterized protein (TIGR02271 family)
MQHTLIAVFDNRSDAERARDDLLLGGFSREDVRISKADATGQTDSLTGRSTASITSEPEEEHGFGASIRNFFSDIFGTDNSPHAQKYSDAVSRGHHVLTVTAADEPEVERAADIVERHGPVDIDEKAAEWAGGAPVSHPESMRMSGAGGMQQSQQPSLQSEGDRKLFAQQDLNQEAPMGNTYQEPMDLDTSLSTAEGGSRQGTTRSTKVQSGSAMGGSMSGSQQRDTGAARSAAIPVVEERLKVGKREVQRGGVRVYSHVVETPVSENIGLREEHVNVERHKVDQPLSPSDTAAFREQEIEMRETAEEAVVEKSARVVEEVVVGKQVSERQQQIKDTVRHTEVQVEQLGRDEDYYRQHWTSNYAKAGGRYEDYQPAYGFGSDMALSETYRGRPWNEVEPALRGDWESRYGSGAASTWEKVKAAVRHGWDRITGDTDSNWRSDWQSKYASSGGTYDDYAPAYRYGSEMAANDQYRGRKWDDVESKLRSDWDARYASGGASTWDKFKAAVRHGWDRMTDETVYRNHWQSNYAGTGASYDDYAPAYGYGSEMARSTKYRGRPWNEVESDLRSDWDTRYASGGASTWDRFKDAVRNGWDRVTS